MLFDSLWSWRGIFQYHGTVTSAKRKNPNRAGTDASKRKDGRYETRATLNTPTGRRRVSFYGATAEEANNKKFRRSHRQTLHHRLALRRHSYEDARLHYQDRQGTQNPHRLSHRRGPQGTPR
jgi:hypothetical protein